MRTETLEFEERYPRERGFAAYFKDHIVEELYQIEERRLKALRNYRWATGITYTFLVMCVLSYIRSNIDSFQITKETFFCALILIFVGAVPGALIEYYFQKTSKSQLMTNIMRFFSGLTYQASSYIPSEDIRNFLIVPSYTHYEGSDRIEARGKYLASRLLLKYKSGSGKRRSTRITFRGVAILIDLARPVKSPIALKIDQGKVLNWLSNVGSGYDRITLVDPVFEEIFEVFGQDQIEARAVLTPDVMELFLRLNFLFSNWQTDLSELERMTRRVLANYNIEEVRSNLKAGLRANYVDDKLLLLFSTPEDLFEPVSLRQSCFDLTLIRAVLYQIDLIDQLHTVLTSKSLKA